MFHIIGLGWDFTKIVFIISEIYKFINTMRLTANYLHYINLLVFFN